MRKGTILVISAIMSLNSCSREQDSLKVEKTPFNAIGFNVYNAEASTKALVHISDSTYSKGVGVFAFYQPAVGDSKVNYNSHKFATPDFMYNQRLEYDNSSSSWWYRPVKYWPNEMNEQISFFAYAPFDENMRWEDLGFSTDATGSKLSTSIIIGDSKETMKDVVFAKPLLNQSAKFDDGANNIAKRLTFDFSHILSMVKIELGVDSGIADAAGAGPWDDPDTEITVNSIVFKGVAESYEYSQTTTATPVVTCTAKGSQTVTLKGDDFQNNVIDSTAWNSTRLGSGPYFKDLLSKELDEAGDSLSAALFFAPQVFEEGVQTVSITYTVKTVDSTNPLNNSTKTNTITKNLSDILPLISGTTDHGFESGKAYLLKFVIGMASVNVTADMTTWSTPKEKEIPVPANRFVTVLSTDEANLQISNVKCSGTGKGLEGEVLSFDVTSAETNKFTITLIGQWIDDFGTEYIREGVCFLCNGTFDGTQVFEEDPAINYYTVESIDANHFHVEFTLPVMLDEDEDFVYSSINVNPIAGVSPVDGGGRTSCKWVQLWADYGMLGIYNEGPRFAAFNLGSTIDSYEDITDYSTDNVGGYYGFGCLKPKPEYRDTAFTPSGYRYDLIDKDAHYTNDKNEAVWGDAARYLWGDAWGLPYSDDLSDCLINLCEWEYMDGATNQYEPGCTLTGWKVSGKGFFADNSIFLPTAGCWDHGTGTVSINPDPEYRFGFYLSDQYLKFLNLQSIGQYWTDVPEDIWGKNGYSIRPIMEVWNLYRVK